MARRVKLRYTSANRRAMRARMISDADFTCRHCGDRLPHPPAEYDGGVTLYWPMSSCWDTLRYLAIDHIVAVHNGGTNDESNLQVLCSTCNGNKGSR